MTIGNVDDMVVKSQINFEHVSGTRKVEIKPSNIHFGAFKGIVQGAVGPEPRSTAWRRARTTPATGSN